MLQSKNRNRKIRSNEHCWRSLQRFITDGKNRIRNCKTAKENTDLVNEVLELKRENEKLSTEIGGLMEKNSEFKKDLKFKNNIIQRFKICQYCWKKIGIESLSGIWYCNTCYKRAHKIFDSEVNGMIRKSLKA